MIIITAPEKLINIDKPTVFLAGGITDCPEWQDEIIKKLKPFDDAILFNPRRKNFPIEDPNAAKEQITWEFDALEQSDIFSMWFCKGKSDQPICMYELGRNVALHIKNIDSIVIGVEKGYKREQDVRIQMELINKKLADKISSNLSQHTLNILDTIENHGKTKTKKIKGLNLAGEL
jgi:hypothetical protein